jgi:hypothetical protein
MGMIDRIKKGKFPAAVPGGWKAIYDQAGTCTFHVDEDAAKVLRLIFLDLFLHAGMGQEAIAERLNQLGYLTPQGVVWKKQNVQQFFRRIWRYAGYGEVNILGNRPYTRAPGNWPAIITADEVEMILAEKERRRNARRSVSSTYLFSLCVWCAECGRRMIVATNVRKRKSRKIQKSLRCPNKEQAHKHRFISESKVREAVRRAIEYLETAENRQQVLAEAGISDVERTTTDIATTKQRISDVQNQLYKADDAFVAGRMDEARYQRQVERLTGQVQQHEQALKKLERKIEQFQHEERRSERLEEIASIGLSMLDHEDVKVANA